MYKAKSVLMMYCRLCQTALFETQKKQREHPDAASRKQMIVFWSVLLFVTLWQFLPEYVFPMLGSMAFLCWVAPRNATANFIGAGFGGMGFLNLSFDVRCPIIAFEMLFLFDELSY